jgi:hypothetical protein
MSWLDKLLPPKIQHSDPAERRQVPEGLWTKCPSCETVLYKADLEQNQMVCPKCSHHHRIRARARLDAFLDGEGRYEVGQEVIPVDALKFKDSKKYPERLKEALEATGETDALVVMGGALMTLPVVVACFDFEFMGGSMGSVVGERFARGVQTAVEQKTPFICFTATGGARMQEGLLSPDADGQVQRRADAVGTRPTALCERADRPDHGGGLGQLCLRRRHGDRRAQGAHRLRRSACHPETRCARPCPKASSAPSSCSRKGRWT